MKGKKWTEQEDRFLRDQYEQLTSSQLGGRLGRSKSSVKNRLQFLNLRKTANHGRFSKSHVPANKGLRQIDYMSEQAIERTKVGRFTKGHVPANRTEVGSIRLRTSRKKVKSDGTPERYYWIKVAEPNQWEHLHRHLWQQANGPIPNGQNVQFLDGTPENCVLENLVLRSRKENIIMNGIANYPPDVISLIRVQKNLEKLINH